MNKFRLTIKLLAIAIFMLAVVSLAQAQAPRTWVSGVGDDANPCSRTAPCKTFAGAISKTAPAGEISVLDPGGFGAVTIGKSLTINGEGTLAGILNSAVNGIIINAATTDNVFIRNISINAQNNGLDGVKILQAKTVTLENVSIAGQTIGVEVLTGANVNVSMVNTTIKNCTTAGVRADTSAGTARVTVRNSMFTNCGTGINPKRNSRVSIEESTISANTLGVLVEGPGGTAIALLKSCHVTNNTSHGLQAGSAASTNTSAIKISDNLINNNAGAGVSISTNGIVETFMNNEINGNNPDGCVGCTNVTGTFN
ncbi:MAG: hypothetical protein QOI77_467 [Blastocatellia bacterium]|jgi:hypothetical protein|nr:hypothetical protein [Blastocatellia bacterium]